MALSRNDFNFWMAVDVTRGPRVAKEDEVADGFSSHIWPLDTRADAPDGRRKFLSLYKEDIVKETLAASQLETPTITITGQESLSVGKTQMDASRLDPNSATTATAAPRKLSRRERNTPKLRNLKVEDEEEAPHPSSCLGVTSVVISSGTWGVCMNYGELHAINQDISTGTFRPETFHPINFTDRSRSGTPEDWCRLMRSCFTTRVHTTAGHTIEVPVSLMRGRTAAELIRVVDLVMEYTALVQHKEDKFAYLESQLEDMHRWALLMQSGCELKDMFARTSDLRKNAILF